MSASTLVTNAKGEVTEFESFVSKFIVAHPKAAALAALVLGFVVAKVI